MQSLLRINRPIAFLPRPRGHVSTLMAFDIGREVSPDTGDLLSDLLVHVLNCERDEREVERLERLLG
jgi:hypothetical protein